MNEWFAQNFLLYATIATLHNAYGMAHLIWLLFYMEYGETGVY